MVDHENVIERLQESAAYFRSSFDALNGTVAWEKFRRWTDAIEQAIALLKAQEPPTDTSILSAIECLLHPQDADDSDMAQAIDTAVRAMRLLKAQEPRVMTLEESYSVDYCFFEYHATGYIEPASVVISGKLLNGKEPLVEVYRLGRDGPAYVMMKDYGHEWRCWYRMPEDGQKEATPWQ